MSGSGSRSEGDLNVAGAINIVVNLFTPREVSRPSAQRANRKVPDICKTFGIRCIDDYQLWRVLNFRIS